MQPWMHPANNRVHSHAIFCCCCCCLHYIFGCFHWCGSVAAAVDIYWVWMRYENIRREWKTLCQRHSYSPISNANQTNCFSSLNAVCFSIYYYSVLSTASRIMLLLQWYTSTTVPDAADTTINEIQKKKIRRKTYHQWVGGNCSSLNCLPLDMSHF